MSHGGKREGAGRKRTGRSTKCLSFEANVEELGALERLMGDDECSTASILRRAFRAYAGLPEK